MSEHMLTRVTTPTHTFTLPSTMGTLTDFYVTYQQNGRIILEKRMGDEGVDLTGRVITVNLTQEDTAKFSDNVKAVVKVKVKTQTGKVMDSQFITITTLQTLHKEAM